MKRLTLVVSLITVLFLSACKEDINEPHFMWGKQKYIATYEPVDRENLEEQIGEIKNLVDGNVGQNGDSKGLAIGTKLFKVKGEEISPEGPGGVIAFERDGEFNIARRIEIYK